MHPTAPVRIEYQLTCLGLSLLDPLAALRQWAIDHRGDVLDAQQSHDQNEAAVLAAMTEST